MRVEQALWNYFHPAFGALDEERLAVLKRLAADRTIHAGMRFDLLGVDYGGTEWGLPCWSRRPGTSSRSIHHPRRYRGSCR